MITDIGYLQYYRNQLLWLINNLPCQLIGVEDNLCIPITSVSHKQEWSARTIRPKIMNKLDYFMRDKFINPLSELIFDENIKFNSNDPDLIGFINMIKKNNYLSETDFVPGENAALKTLDEFVNNKLSDYNKNRNNPEKHATSRLSPYLHFGMISPISIVEKIIDNPLSAPFIEQIVVRRELAHNFIWYNNMYNKYNALPGWCLNTLKIHSSDLRTYIYDKYQLENINTHDECWNAAMHEMVQTGYMENTMRMYWGKKIIEWSNTPEEAFDTITFLNNKYFLDGRDANSWTGIAWCFGLHDRPWVERPIFGKIRYMNKAGLYRKYNMIKYISENKNSLH